MHSKTASTAITQSNLIAPDLNSDYTPAMPAKKKQHLVGNALVKEVCRRIRVARTLWDQHKNAGCRQERLRALELYAKLTKEQAEQIPQELRVWLRYRSEKYFGEGRKGNGANSKG